jgi:hypothetical protein
MSAMVVPSMWNHTGTIMAKMTAVSSKTVDLNCWLPRRFVLGQRCARVMTCNYPEKQGCKAVQAEIDYMEQLKVTEAARWAAKIQKLQEMIDGAIRRLKGEQGE